MGLHKPSIKQEEIKTYTQAQTLYTTQDYLQISVKVTLTLLYCYQRERVRGSLNKCYHVSLYHTSHALTVYLKYQFPLLKFTRPVAYALLSDLPYEWKQAILRSSLDVEAEVAFVVAHYQALMLFDGPVLPLQRVFLRLRHFSLPY